MPDVAAHYCARCHGAHAGRGCPKRQRAYDRMRASTAARALYRTRRWKTERLVFLKENPLCVEHHRQGDVVPATEVDHVRPHAGDPRLFWDRGNWQGLCHSCHSIKTATEQASGGVGG